MRGINLMSPQAQAHAALRRQLRGWIFGVGGLVFVLAALAAFNIHRVRYADLERQALEAQYEPIRQLNADSRRLRADVETLVRSERPALELSRERPVTSLIGMLNQTVAKTGGELFLQQITITQNPLAGAASAGAGHMILRAAATPKYDVSQFVERLSRAPLAEAKVVSTDEALQDGISRKNYMIECSF